MIFTRHSIDPHSQVHSQVWLQSAPGSTGVALTPPADDCAQPAVSPDGKALAMVCRHGQVRTTDLVTAPLDLASGSIGTAVTLVSGKLVAAPAFSGDGSTLAYLSPAGTVGQFQLWTIAASGSGSLRTPVQVTQNLGFDATSAPVWLP